MKVELKDKSSFFRSHKKAAMLEEELNRLLSKLSPDLVIPIEIRDSPSFCSKLRKFLATRSLKPFDGEVISFPKRKIILYKRAFKGSFSRLMHITLHEIGHYLDFDYRNQRERERRANAFAESFGYGPSLGE